MAQGLSTQIAGCGGADRKLKRELQKLEESGGESCLGVFAPSFKRRRIRIGPQHQAAIPPLKYDSEERGEKLVETHVLVVPAMCVLLEGRKRAYDEQKAATQCDSWSVTELCSTTESAIRDT